MVKIIDLIREIELLGFSIEVYTDSLRLLGDRGKLPLSLVNRIRERKAEIIAFLQAPTIQEETKPADIPLAGRDRSDNRPPKREPQPCIYRCGTCHGADWGKTGVLQDGTERWGCLTCRQDQTSEPTCPQCGSTALVTDSVGKYCVP